jgi:hypothetical protein
MDGALGAATAARQWGEVAVEASTTADQWLEDIDRAGRELIDVVAGLTALDEMEKMHQRPSVGWMQRYTKRSTESLS